MILKGDKKGPASIILRRIKGIPGYEDLKNKNEDKMAPSLYGKEASPAEPEYEEKPLTSSNEDGMERAAENLIEAISSKNPKSMKMHLKAMMKMMMSEEDENEE